MSYISGTSVSLVTSTTLQENIGNQMQDGSGGLFAETYLAFYTGSTPVAQAAAVTALTTTPSTTDLATAITSIIAVMSKSSGVGLTAN